MVMQRSLSEDTDTDTDTDNFFNVSSGVYIVKYIFKSWNNQQLKLCYKRPTLHYNYKGLLAKIADLLGHAKVF